jgi:hypothetical protein
MINLCKIPVTKKTFTFQFTSSRTGGSMKKILITAIALAVLQAYGSTVMIVNSSNGSRDVYQLSDVQKMTFQSVTLGVHHSGIVPSVNSFSVANQSLRLSLTTKAMVSARLFSYNGRVYGTFPDKQYSPGSYLLSFDKNGALATGVYILQVKMAGKVFNQKMVVGR